MPSITVDVRMQYPEAQEIALLETIHGALVDAFHVLPAHRNATLTVHPASRFLGRPDCATPDRLTNISIYALPGRSIEAKRLLYKLLVERLEAFGVPRNCVLIRLIELPAENFGVRGGYPVCDVDLGYPVNI